MKLEPKRLKTVTKVAGQSLSNGLLGLAAKNPELGWVVAFATPVANQAVEGVSDFVENYFRSRLYRTSLNQEVFRAIPLSEKLPLVKEKADLRLILEEMDFKRANTARLAEIIRRGKDEGRREMLREFLCDVLDDIWVADARTARVAAAVLTGLSRFEGGMKGYEARFGKFISDGIENNDAERSGAIESLGFNFAVVGNQGITEALQKWRIDNIMIRKKDAREDLAFLGGSEDEYEAARQRHYEERKEWMLASSHDCSRTLQWLVERGPDYYKKTKSAKNCSKT